MRWIDIFRTSFKMLRNNLLRTLLTTLGIATAIALIVVLIGMGYGVQELTLGSIVQSKSLLSLDIIASQDETSSPLTAEAIEDIKKIPGVAAASPVLDSEGQIEYRGRLISNNIRAGNKELMAMDGINL